MTAAIYSSVFCKTALFRFGYCGDEQYLMTTVSASFALCVNTICPTSVPRKLFRISENWSKEKQVYIPSYDKILLSVFTRHP